jgi:PHD/YefM family antitoxin component YafN of YafNO toxin-antitoxin module
MRTPLPAPDRFVVDERGNKEAVILPLEQYEQMLEDLHDLAVVAERRVEEPVAWEEVKERLKRDGLL